MNTDIDGDLLEQLSAMLDGELDADRQRFLMQRMQHDGALRERWERWQLASACLKRQPVQRLPADFVERVLGNLDAASAADLDQAGFNTAHAAVDGEPVQRARSPWRWVGGLAVAASLGLTVVLLHPFAGEPDAVVPTLANSAGASTHADSVAATDGIPQLAIQRQPIPLPMPHVDLPIPVRAGVVSVYRSPLRVMAVMPNQRLAPNFSPLPQPYAIDPELEAYLARQKSAATGKRDVFSEHDVYLPTDNDASVGTVSWSQMEPSGYSP